MNLHPPAAAQSPPEARGARAAVGELGMPEAAESESAVHRIMGAHISIYERCQRTPGRPVEAAVNHYIGMVRAWLNPASFPTPTGALR